MRHMEDTAWLTRESARYMGAREGTLPTPIRALLSDSLDSLRAVVTPRHAARAYPLVFLPPDTLEAAGKRFESAHLAKALAGCTHAVFFAATLGAQADRLIAREERVHVARAVALQACGAALIEAYCDDVCIALDRHFRSQGLFLRPRFSPGYGDFPLDAQRAILGVLDAPRSIGLTLTDACMMAPLKSVSALIGLSPEPPSPAPASSCASCARTDCAYRLPDGRG